MQVLESRQNQRIKAWIKLHHVRGRNKAHAYLVEGHHMVEEAHRWGQEIETLILTERSYETYASFINSQQLANRVQLVSPSLMEQLAQTEHSQEILACIRMKQEEVIKVHADGKYLLLDAIQDPGNLGTMIRLAAAAAYDGVFIGEGCVDLYNDKVLRATQGSIWQVPIQRAPLEEVINELHKHDVLVCATALDERARDYRSLSRRKGLAFVMGNEGQGVQADLLNQVDETLYIPMPGPTESLNVAIACGIIVFYYL